MIIPPHHVRSNDLYQPEQTSTVSRELPLWAKLWIGLTSPACFILLSVVFGFLIWRDKRRAARGGRDEGGAAGTRETQTRAELTQSLRESQLLFNQILGNPRDQRAS